MPHYIWQSNLLLILSVEREKRHLTFVATEKKKLFSVSRVYSFLFLLDFAKALAYMQLFKV